MSLLTTYIIYYSLFQKRIIPYSEIVNYLPINAFGIFTTIIRHKKLLKWPNDIHGCMGYWDKNFNILSKIELHNQLLRSSINALWKDNRRSYFAPIEMDPKSELKMSFMLKPIYKITNSGIISELGKIFNNDIYGIIIQSGGKVATFLPNVFSSNTNWEKILKDIKNKANIEEGEHYKLFSYKTFQMSASFISILTNHIHASIQVTQFMNFLLITMNNKLEFPLVYYCNNGKLEWNSSDDVRNIAIMGDLLKYITYFKQQKWSQKFIKKISIILNNFEKYSAQALSFLGNAILYNSKKRKICEKLYKNFLTADKDFGQPEIMIGLKYAECDVIFDEVQFNYSINDSIFRINWVIQVLYAYNRHPTQEMILIVQQKVKSILSTPNIETNYLAVSFEALCYLYNIVKDLNILKYIFLLFVKLEHRKIIYYMGNKLYGLYPFLNKQSRIDITGHITNGWLMLLKA